MDWHSIKYTYLNTIEHNTTQYNAVRVNSISSTQLDSIELGPAWVYLDVCGVWGRVKREAYEQV